MYATRQLMAAALLALLGAAANTAMAQEATRDTWIDAVAATRPRTQVQADLARARKDGTIKFGSAGYIEPMRSLKTRDQVRAETAAARASGELEAIDAEVYRYAPAPAPLLAQGK